MHRWCLQKSKTEPRLDLARRWALLTSSATALAGVAGTSSGCAEREVPADACFTLLDGTPSRLSAWKSKALLVNFWATSCTVAGSFRDLLATPTGFLLGRSGAIARRRVGTPEPAQLHGAIEKLLGQT